MKKRLFAMLTCVAIVASATAETYSYSGRTTNLIGNPKFQSYDSITFDENVYTYSTYTCGGVIWSDVSVNFYSNGPITFSNNMASSTRSYYTQGGAIYGATASLTFTSNGDVTFSGNAASNSCLYSTYGFTQGGAIYIADATFKSNGNISFSGNMSNSAGSYARAGAIYGSSTFTSNGGITFSGNTASTTASSSYDYAFAYGGAIYGSSTFTGNGDITFSGNTASSSSYYAYGGAIYGSSTFTGNGDIIFSGNKTSGSTRARGGAIYADGTLSFTENTGDITFSGNKTSGSTSAYGGAIYADGTLSFTENTGDIKFSGNMVSNTSDDALGGAIYVWNSLVLQGSALFERNAENNNGTYRLRSIYQIRGSSLELSAPTDKCIEFHDSIFSNASVVSFNGSSSTQTTDGTVRFTGATTEEDLYAVKGSAGTEAEITASRTSSVDGKAILYGGKLIVEEKAVLNIGGTLTTGTGSCIEVSTGAQLNLAKSNTTVSALTLGGGTVTLGSVDDHAATLTTTTLMVTADSTLNANLVMTSGTLTFFESAVLTMGCSVCIGDSVTIVLDDDVVSRLQNGTISNYVLMDSVESSTVGDVTITNTKGHAMESGWTVQRTESGKLTVTPEPATSTLSLLALAGLCARRRRH